MRDYSRFRDVFRGKSNPALPIIIQRMERISEYITFSPEIRFGKPCIAGTRIAVQDILQWLADGMSAEEILEDYPLLRHEHIRAALAFAADRETYIKILVA